MKYLNFLTITLFLFSIQFSRAAVPSYLFSCAVSMNNSTNFIYAYVNAEKPEENVYFYNGLTVTLKHINNSQLTISISENGQVLSPTTVVDGTRATQFAMTANGVSLNCLTQVQK